MIYTDGVHLVGSTIRELHAFAKQIVLPACWYNGYKKGHPHYDINNEERLQACYDAGAMKVSTRDIVTMFQAGELQRNHRQAKQYKRR